MAYTLSTFPDKLDQIQTMYDISPSDKPEIDEYFTLCMLTNPTTDQVNRMNVLLAKYDNKIINAEKINYWTSIAINTEEFWFDTMNNYLKFINNYDSTYPYKIYNTTMDANGDVYMSLISNNVGNPLSDSNYWKKISQRGLQGIQGIQGIPGVGFNPQGEFDSSKTYITPQCVTFGGELWGCISPTPISGISPQNDGVNWLRLVQKGASTTLATLRKSTQIITNTSTVAIGISGYNMLTDQIFVVEKINNTSMYIEKDVDYTISSDGLSINKISGSWDGSTTPITFDFVIFKNVADSVLYSDGALIADGSITINKLNNNTQSQINKIGTAVLQTIAQDLSGAINENTNEINTLNEESIGATLYLYNNAWGGF